MKQYVEPPAIGKLRDFFAQGDMTKKEFAQAIGVGQPHLSQILSGHRPILQLGAAAKVEAATGGLVQMRDFLSADLRAAIDTRGK